MKFLSGKTSLFNVEKFPLAMLGAPGWGCIIPWGPPGTIGLEGGPIILPIQNYSELNNLSLPGIVDLEEAYILVGAFDHKKDELIQLGLQLQYQACNDSVNDSYYSSISDVLDFD